MTQEDLAEHLGLQNSSVGKWERGINQPNPDTLIVLSGLFSVSVDDLLKQDLSARPQVQGKGERANLDEDLAATIEALQAQVKANHELLTSGPVADAYREQLEIFKRQLIRRYPDVAREMGLID